MASNTLTTLLLLLVLQSALCVAVWADDDGVEFPQEKESPISKEELQALLEKDLAANASVVDTTGGEENGDSGGIWSWLARLNGAGTSEEEGSTEQSGLAEKKKKKKKKRKGEPALKKKRKGGHHPKGRGMRRGRGMRKGKGMHKRRRVPSPVTGRFKADIVVAADGSGQYKKVQQAINAAKRGAPGKPFVIYVKGGSYFEKCLVPYTKQYLTIIGDKGRTRIYYDDAASKLDGESRTARSASFTILADDFTAVDITFENSFGWPNGREGSQAVAVTANCDKAQFYGCTFLGHQDTLFSMAGRQYYKGCRIVGQVDFIFGNARAIYQDCLIEVITNAVNRYSAVVAQNRPKKSYNSGFVFLGGRVIGTGAAFPQYGTYLGRTWGPWSTVVYINVQIDCPVTPDGWSNMGEPKNEKNAILLGYMNKGVGANARTWKIGRLATKKEAAIYDGLDYIDGDWVTVPAWWRG